MCVAQRDGINHARRWSILNHETSETLKHVADVGSIGTVLATLAGWLPEISALLSAVWVAIRIYETETVRKLLGKK
jgi:hypothetical protein